MRNNNTPQYKGD